MFHASGWLRLRDLTHSSVSGVTVGEKTGPGASQIPSPVYFDLVLLKFWETKWQILLLLFPEGSYSCILLTVDRKCLGSIGSANFSYV